MANIGIFDVLGPIMIGPSSSHTAGAARLGKIARTIVNKPIKDVTFLLHGSFKVISICNFLFFSIIRNSISICVNNRNSME